MARASEVTFANLSPRIAGRPDALGVSLMILVLIQWAGRLAADFRSPRARQRFLTAGGARVLGGSRRRASRGPSHSAELRLPVDR
jgi:hypothetical protein